MTRVPGAPPGTATAGGQPAHGQPAHGQPAHGQPTHGQPTGGEPTGGAAGPARYHAEYAWLGGDAPVRDVRIEVVGGRILDVRPGTPADGATRLPGLTLPGFANAHSHAFHRALRGRGGASGTFWTWRERMYALAGRLDPETYHRLARAVYGEMVLAGITAVGEFHYLHHAPGGRAYADPNAMGHALIAAAAEAGIRITMLDTVYLTSTVDGEPPSGAQTRFCDGSPEAWAARAADLRTPPHARRGAALHSVRAVPAPAIGAVVDAARGLPLHVHLSEQPAENDACRARYGVSPTALLHAHGALGPSTTAVHATHLSTEDIRLLGGTGTVACLCPTTERDLADGIGPGGPLVRAGSPLCLGSDAHAAVDPFAEARAVEEHERLRTGRRGHFSPGDLLSAATAAGHRALGWPDAGAIAPGQRADLVTVDLDSVRTAGAEPLSAAVFAATAADVIHVVVDGRPVVRDRRHRMLDVARELRAAVSAVTS